MNFYNLNLNNDNIGGYFSSEQIDFLTIIQCQTFDELTDFVKNCIQLKNVFSEQEISNFKNIDLEELKREVFKRYQDTLVYHNSNGNIILDNKLKRLGITKEDIEVIKKAYTLNRKEAINYIRIFIKNKYPQKYIDICKYAHEFQSKERDQNKYDNLYDELALINENLSTFNTLLVGSGKPETVINELLFSETNGVKHYEFDYYYAKRDLDFAYRNNKHIRFHSLLTKPSCEELFKGQTKEEIIDCLTKYVKSTIDFVNEYNKEHILSDGTPVINAIDLFNEIVSFDEMIFDNQDNKWKICEQDEKGEYYVIENSNKNRPLRKGENPEYKNIWEINYGITIEDLSKIFQYALVNKPECINYLYNEPFLENPKRRKKVFEILKQINIESKGLIDTLGSQMHITIRESLKEIEDCFKDFKELQENMGINIQITEFDLSIGNNDMINFIKNNPEKFFELAYEKKEEMLHAISYIIEKSEVELNGLSYWSLTDKIDCNLERIRTYLLEHNIIKDVNQIPTVCGGLFPTAKEQKKNKVF